MNAERIEYLKRQVCYATEGWAGILLKEDEMDDLLALLDEKEAQLKAGEAIKSGDKFWSPETGLCEAIPSSPGPSTAPNDAERRAYKERVEPLLNLARLKWSDGSETCPFCSGVIKEAAFEEECPCVISGKDYFELCSLALAEGKDWKEK